jgi:hypothetical protein
MNFKRFRYRSGHDIIAPMKHGTRWLEEKTNPISIEEIFSIKEIEGITKETYWIYREPKKHMVSALRTEIRSAIEYHEENTDLIIDSFINDGSHHWSPTLYESLYQHWNKIGFNLIHLNDLSNLFPQVKYLSNDYDMGHLKKTNHTTEDIIKLVGLTKINELYKMCDKDELWLKRILNNERGLTTYKLLMEKQNTIDKLINDISNIKNDSKLVQEKLEGDILNLKMKLKHIKRELI